MKQRKNEHKDRWLLSYADLVTLLFACMAVLYALAMDDRSKIAELEQSNRRAFSGGNTDDHPVEKKDKRFSENPYHALVSSLNVGKSEVQKSERSLSIEFPSTTFFSKKGERLLPGGTRILNRIMKGIDSRHPKLQIESTWVLKDQQISSAELWRKTSRRANLVARYLVEEWTYKPERISASARVVNAKKDVTGVSEHTLRFVFPLPSPKATGMPP